MKTRIALWCLWGAITAGSALAADPVIHVAWEDPGSPVEGIHFIVSGDPAFPDVELIEGSLTWQIWSTDTDNPGGVGDIGFITSPQPKNFGVKIEDDLGNPGARTVKAIILDPTNAGNFSNITGGRITGNLDGDLSVKQSDTGTGGEVDFTIDGNATGNITIATIPTGASLEIGGNVETSSAIYIAEIGPGGAVNIDGDLSGKLELQNGIPDNTCVRVENLTTSGVIELGGQGVGQADPGSCGFTLTVGRGQRGTEPR